MFINMVILFINFEIFFLILWVLDFLNIMFVFGEYIRLFSSFEGFFGKFFILGKILFMFLMFL